MEKVGAEPPEGSLAAKEPEDQVQDDREDKADDQGSGQGKAERGVAAGELKIARQPAPPRSPGPEPDEEANGDQHQTRQHQPFSEARHGRRWYCDPGRMARRDPAGTGMGRRVLPEQRWNGSRRAERHGVAGRDAVRS